MKMNCVKQFPLLAALGCLVFVMTTVPSSGRAADVTNNTVSVQLKSRQKLFYAGKNRVWQKIILANPLTQYELNIGSEVNEAGELINTFVGIANPQQSWWCNGFMRLAVENAYLDPFPCIITILEQGRRGCVEFLYRHPGGDARCRLLLHPDDEMLYIEWAADGGAGGRKRLELSCVPAVANMLAGQTDLGTRRAVRTGLQAMPEGKTNSVANPQTENWALLLDQAWDMADESKRTAHPNCGVTGPAGVIFQPLPQMELQYEVGPVYITTRASYPPETSLIRLAVGEFRALGNEKAFAKLKAAVPAVMDRMKSLRTTPCKFVDADFEGMQQQAAALLKQATPEKIKSSGNLQTNLQHLIEARQNWDKEYNTTPIATDRSLQSAYDQFASERNRLERSMRKTGKVLVVKGIYNSFYKMSEVRKRYPALMHAVKEAYVRKDFNFGFYLDYFPPTIEEIMQFDAVILADADVGALQDEGMELLCSYIEGGGGLVILGGYYSFGLSTIYETKLGNLLPVRSERFDLRPLGDSANATFFQPSGSSLRPIADRSPLTGNLKWDLNPRSIWQHRVKPAKDAVIEVTVGDDPFLVTGRCGQGRIAAFTGSVLGTPAKGVLPFWEWESWPDLLGRVIAWAADKPAK